jgi:hypothetical protein
MSFLSDLELRPLELGDARAFRPVGLALGKGAQPVEVAVIEVSQPALAFRSANTLEGAAEGSGNASPYGRALRYADRYLRSCRRSAARFYRPRS